MKIKSLKVKEFRGLIDFDCAPNGNNVIISGPNGSGKSALVDAIDFLFTGKVSRLKGAGAGDLSLQAHGPYVGHSPKNAIVSGVIILPSGEEYAIERNVSQYKKLVCTPEPTPEAREALALAERGCYVLSRKEILRYIASESGTRATDIQALLNLGEIEKLRKLLYSTCPVQFKVKHFFTQIC